MRTTYIVCYDIRNPRRLRRVHKTCLNWGNHLQFSIFECDLTPHERLRFEDELRPLINQREDQVLFISLGPAESRSERTITALGQPYHKFSAPCYIV